MKGPPTCGYGHRGAGQNLLAGPTTLHCAALPNDTKLDTVSHVAAMLVTGG